MNAPDRTSSWLRVAVNAGLGGIFLAVLALAAEQISQQGREWRFDVCVSALVCVIALLRNRNRTWAAFAGMAVSTAAVLLARVAHLPGEPGAAAILGLLVLCATAVRSVSVCQAASVVATGFALSALGWVTADPAAWAPRSPFEVCVQGWVLATGAGLGLRWRDYRRRAIAEMVRQDERLALARELHDVVAHHITGIVLQAQAARIVASRQSGPAAGGKLDDTLAGIERAGTDALAAMRRVVGLLRDAEDGATTSPPTGPEPLADLVRRFGEHGHGPIVSLKLPSGMCRSADAEPGAAVGGDGGRPDSGPLSWPPEVATTIYRIVQEALTNIARHAANAHSAEVNVTQDEDFVTVEITDDAPLAPVRHLHHGGYGLVGMRERVTALGGAMTAGPRPGAGWSVRAALPVGIPGRATARAAARVPAIGSVTEVGDWP